MRNFTETSIPDIQNTVTDMFPGSVISFSLGDLTVKGSGSTDVQQAFAKARVDKVRITCQEKIAFRNSVFSDVRVTGERDNVLRFLAELQRLRF